MTSRYGWSFSSTIFLFRLWLHLLEGHLLVTYNPQSCEIEKHMEMGKIMKMKIKKGFEIFSHG